MRFTLTIDMDNAAFEGDDQPYELRRCLQSVANLVGPGNEWSKGNVRDYNGNNVGTFRIEDD